MREKSRMMLRGIALILTLLLCLSGCAGQEQGQSTPAPTALESQDPAPTESQGPDYTKYNTYLELMNFLYEMDDCLSDYFTQVAYQEQFRLLDGGDFGDILSDMVFFSGGFFIGEDPFEAALTVAELEPAYDGLDQAMREMVPEAQKVYEALTEMVDYITDYTYQDDGYAGAAPIHAALFPLLDPYYAKLDVVVQQMSEVEEVLRQEDLNGLLERNEMIAFYSNYMFFGIEDLYELAYQEENLSGDEVYIQNVEAFAAICEEIKGHTNSMLEALEDPDQRAKVDGLNFYTENENDWEYKSYKSYKYYGESIIRQMDEMVADAGEGRDLGPTLRSFYYDYEYMIDAYNRDIVG